MQAYSYYVAVYTGSAVVLSKICGKDNVIGLDQ